MLRSALGDYKDGWLLGNFSPAVIQTNDFEICIKSFEVGDCEPLHYQITATEVTVILSGKVRMGEMLLTEDEILVVEPGEVIDFEALTACKVLGIKFPSLPGDKVLA